ncbi:MAG: hypothetical protein WCP97_01155 [bacterium]
MTKRLLGVSVSFGVLLLLLVFLVSRVRAQSQVTLAVDASKSVHAFSHDMLGMGYVNWDHSWGKPFLGNIPGLAEATGELKPGIIRYAGGLWANSVGFDGTAEQRTPYKKWNYPGDSSDYWFHYSTNEIDSLASYAKAVGSEVMIQVNVNNNNPKMWAEMVRYTNVEKGYKFRYWELGNEMDLENKVSAEEYSRRIQEYIKQMLAVDPTIEIIGAATAGPIQQDDGNSVMKGYMTQPLPASRAAGKDLAAITYHWYQSCNGGSVDGITRYAWYNNDGSPIDPLSWRNAYSRIWAKLIPQRVQKEVLSGYPNTRQGITELNVEACNFGSPVNGSFMSALWFTDVLGNLAYNGVDFVTMYMGYGAKGEPYGLTYADNDTNPSRIFVRPTYSALLLYARYFGDTMVQASSSDLDHVSIYASLDSKDTGRLKLMVVNLSGNDITAPISLQGFTANSGSLYQLKSSKPTDLSDWGASEDAPVTINGVHLVGSSIADSISKINPVAVTVSGSSLEVTLPAYTANVFVLDGEGALVTPIPSPVVTVTSVATAVSSPALTVSVTPELGEETKADDDKKHKDFYASGYAAQWVAQRQASDYEGNANDGDEYFDAPRCAVVDFWAELKNVGTKPWLSSKQIKASAGNEFTFATYKDSKAKSAPSWTGFDSCPGKNCGKSYFHADSWVSDYRIGTLEKDVTNLGETAKISMQFKVPCDAEIGRYREDISAASGKYWVRNKVNGDPLQVMHIWFGVDVKK